MKKLREVSLYPIIGKYLEEKYYKVAYEVPVGKFHPRIFDVVGINCKEVVSVEVKLNKFRRAFQQAITRLYYSDKVFVAFPEQYTFHVDSVYRPDLERAGIGLLSVNNTVTQKLEAKQSTFLNANRKKKLLGKAMSCLKSENWTG